MAARHAVIGGIAAGVLAAAGCASRGGPSALAVPPASYGAVFDAAVEAGRRAGLHAALRDRRGGIIETESRIAGSILEPWRLDNAGVGESIGHTLNFERRRARFEFVPAGFRGPREPAPPGAATGPDLLAAADEAAETDLSALAATEGAPNLELRVWVFLERAHTPGLRRSTWTRSKTSRARDPAAPDTSLWEPRGEMFRTRSIDRERGGTMWAVVGRDPAMEQRLLADVARRISAAPR
jgi:hypothetical protein